MSNSPLKFEVDGDKIIVSFKDGRQHGELSTMDGICTAMIAMDRELWATRAELNKKVNQLGELSILIKKAEEKLNE